MTLPGIGRPPAGFRSDAVGIFAVMALAGLGVLVTDAPTSVDQSVEGWAVTVWAVTMLLGGTLGLVALYLPARLALTGLALHLTARAAIATVTLAYAGAVFDSLGLGGGRFVLVLTYVGISFTCGSAAVQLVRWLRQRQRLVEVLLEQQQHDREGRA